MGKLFKFADKEATQFYYYVSPTEENKKQPFTTDLAVAQKEDKEPDYIELRKELSKGEVNRLLSVSNPTGERDIEGGLKFLERFFELSVVSWSMTDDTGDPLPPAIETYRELEAGGAKWIDTVLGEQLNHVMGREVEELEGKLST